MDSEIDIESKDQVRRKRNPPTPLSPGPHLDAGVPETPTVEAQLFSHCVHHCLTSEPLGIYKVTRSNGRQNSQHRKGAPEGMIRTLTSRVMSVA